MPFAAAPPGMLGPHADADARAPGDLLDPMTAIFDVELVAQKIDARVLQSNPHRVREVAWAFVELVIGNARRLFVPDCARPYAAPAHQRNAIDWLQCANQYRRR